ncbi:hypothetical protein N0V93_006117 [Gnomoniopsis smithogilvyi]|uniref:Uncharacterized protein n=1 Tax=Gnomoniopsis smithogilvyi TaxID=1191159 RepID=A0A9W8YMP2_9PEZI|nr:hypothetical protein N0V93_006117 [Gnomoniopsis smithogilvyi]
MEYVSLEPVAQAIDVDACKKNLVVVDAIPVENESDTVSNKPLGQESNGRYTITIPAFDPHTEPGEAVFPVSILDCIMPRILVPVTCTYQLGNDVVKETLLSQICEGLRRLMGEYRSLAGALYEPVGGGRAFVKRTSSHANFVVHVQDLTITIPDFPSFAELKRRHFPASELDERMLPGSFTPAPVPPPGEGVPAMVVQFNLIQGGLIMGIAVHHMIVDARGLDKLIARWAAHTRSVIDSARFSIPLSIQNCDLDPAMLDLTISKTGEKVIDYRKQAVASLKYAPNAPPASDIPPSAMEQHIWHIPASKLAALKASAAPVAGDDKQQWVSTNDCVTALMWRAVTRSRLGKHGVTSPKNDKRHLALENSLDVREAFRTIRSEGIPEAYVGNVVMFSKATMPLCQLIAPETFRAVAVKTREAIDTYRAWPTVQRAIDWISACPRGADVEMDFHAVGGLDFVTTSWRVLKAYERADFGFGPLAALRWATAVFDGYCFLYPTRPSGNSDEGMEIYMGLEKDCMKRLLLDEELARWAEVRN